MNHATRLTAVWVLVFLLAGSFVLAEMPQTTDSRKPATDDGTGLTLRSYGTVGPGEWTPKGSADSRYAVVYNNGMDYSALGASQWDSVLVFDALIADDFIFEKDRFVTDIHWIGGYWNGPPWDGNFDWRITFYNDIGDTIPGPVMTSIYFTSDEVSKTLVDSTGSANYYSYSVNLGGSYFFYSGTKYWISIQGIGLYQPQSGWAYHTTTIRQHQAVFRSDYFGYPTWTNTVDIFGDPVDMCFQLTGISNDYGDAPDGPYPTLRSNNGACHEIVPGMYLGTAIDDESDGQPSITALGDDSNQIDDEDGVAVLTLLYPGSLWISRITASASGYLDAWVDWNADGDWDDAAEQICSGYSLSPGSNIYIDFVPADAAIGTTYSRFRFSSAGGLPYFGFAPDGEVEDYRIFITEQMEDKKWEQLPDLDSTGMDVDMNAWHDIPANGLAGDFPCRETGPITGIRFWGSFFDDNLPSGGPGDLTFIISIYSDIPAGVSAPWSMPGDLLWSRIFLPGDYTAAQVADNNPEDWFNPLAPSWLNDDHKNAYQFDFSIDREDAFVQDSGTVYWLRIVDSNLQYDYLLGWKTTHPGNNWNDDAVWLCDPPAFWCPLMYPPGHEFGDTTSIDLAFAISTAVCDCEPGNCNGDSKIDMLDILYMISYLFKGGPAPIPYALCSMDANCDCKGDMLDILDLIAYLYKGGPPPCTCEDWLSACGSPLRTGE